MAKIVDLSPAVPHGFKGPPSTDLGVQMNVRTRSDPGFWMSTQLDLMSLHTGTHVESALHSIEDGEAIDEDGLVASTHRDAKVLQGVSRPDGRGGTLDRWLGAEVGRLRLLRGARGPAARLDGGQVRRAPGDPGRGHPAHRGAREPEGPAAAGSVLRTLLQVQRGRERPRSRVRADRLRVR